MLRGVIERDEDVSGVTGTGSVAEFVIATDGRVTIFWPVGEGHFPSLQDAINTHGHNGKTRFIILDDGKSQIDHCKVCHSYVVSNRKMLMCSLHDFGCPGCLNGVS